MISIEKDKSEQDRYEYNAPFHFIEQHFGNSSEVLPRLNLSRKCIVWLDYSDSLDDYHLEDITTLAANLLPFSIILITLNHDNRNYIVDKQRKTLKDIYNEMSERLGPEKLSQFEIRDMKTNILPGVFRKIIRNDIISVLNRRKLSFVDLYSLQYRDSAKMMTFGGIIMPAGKEIKVKKIFNGYQFMFTDFFYEIKYPLLTIKEQIVCMKNVKKIESFQCFNPEEIQKYKELYRYIPTFAEAIF